MEIIKLIGVLVVIVGLALKLDTLATVVVAGIITGPIFNSLGIEKWLKTLYLQGFSHFFKYLKNVVWKVQVEIFFIFLFKSFG